MTTQARDNLVKELVNNGLDRLGVLTRLIHLAAAEMHSDAPRPGPTFDQTNQSEDEYHSPHWYPNNRQPIADHRGPDDRDERPAYERE
ncbi:MAG: hypothetical protein P4N59_11610 [Negativicutes bacterium]|nr:hypothetical protein [Negativicutes bacterium]